ncbi:ABC transporter ATP-binding protein [Paenibacillus sp. UNC451MF]|uniref:ABC transporter ATP-binding protein n=1 Tax=Paenibacillus sp. UNC451MF TaxID=1449063 RepID=UPI00048E3CF6|nr:ABC transporter ATP-binding protein [Paenibacillus sp. UNC451MF]
MEHVLYYTRKLHAYAGKVLYMNLLGMTLIGLLDGIGIFLLIPLLSVSGLLSIQTSAIPFMGMLDFLKDVSRPVGLLLILGLYFLLVVGQAAIQRNLSLRDVQIHAGFVNHVRMETYQALLQANWSFFIKKRKSDLINSMTNELARVTNGTYVFLQLLASLVFMVIQIGIALWLSAKMTLFVLACGLIMALFSRTFIRKFRMLGTQTSDVARSYIGGITDHFNGIKDIKSNMLEPSRYRWLQNWSVTVAQERYEQAKLGSQSQFYYKAASTLIIAVFIYFSVTLFQTQGEQLLLIIMIFSRLWPRFTGIQSNLEQIAAAIPAFTSLTELQKECMETREVSIGTLDYNQVKPLRIQEGIECKDIYFRYDKNSPIYALEHIQLSIGSNQMTAIIGRSGAGKSTLIDIIMGLLQPDHGQVLIDGVPLTKDNLLRLRKAISYVPQDPFLFNGTIRENLLLMNPNSTEEELWEAIQFAAGEFVSRLPQGLDTLIGDRGVRLSGGERQRLVLARAILRKPSILVLDEATSSLDTENEAKIQEALERLKGTMTIIVIAHRLSTIRNADQVIVLDEGAIVQRGGFNQLAKERGKVFAHLLGSQFQDSTMISQK